MVYIYIYIDSLRLINQTVSMNTAKFCDYSYIFLKHLFAAVENNHQNI